jgi:hypothetical protein
MEGLIAWNTGRAYTAKGQRIADIDRNISYLLALPEHFDGEYLHPADVLEAYDKGKILEHSIYHLPVYESLHRAAHSLKGE